MKDTVSVTVNYTKGKKKTSYQMDPSPGDHASIQSFAGTRQKVTESSMRTGILEKEHNGIKVHVAIIGPEFVVKILEELCKDVIENCIHT